jgi:hypothetical protein
MKITNLSLEPRLQQRYGKLVKSHMRSAPAVAAGIRSLPTIQSSFAATQAAWRFLNNERVEFPALIEPLRKAGLAQTQRSPADFVMLVHDWCKLSFDHAQKRDRVQVTHDTDVGYELTTALLVDAHEGQPLAPMEMHVKTARGVLSTRAGTLKVQTHLEQVLPTMQASRSWSLSKPLLHVIDREADSVDHYRHWDERGHFFLIRADDRRVKWNGTSILLSEIALTLRDQRAFKREATALYQGQTLPLWVAQTEVVLYRAAKKNVHGKRFHKAGRALTLRLIVVQVRNAGGQILAQWLLLSNAPLAWTAAVLSRCYYWRWRIESFFKLLKSHGHQLEQWQQQTGEAIARRLLIASMACVVVWQLQADSSSTAAQFRTILVRLSGRQTKRHRPHTAPALLAGFWSLLSTLSLLEHHNLKEILGLIKKIPSLPEGLV